MNERDWKIYDAAMYAYLRANRKTFEFYMNKAAIFSNKKGRTRPASKEARRTIAYNEAWEAGMDAAIKTAIRLARKKGK